MATNKQKESARRNIKKARAAQTAQAGGKKKSPGKSGGMSTETKNRLPNKDFAFPDERKEPLLTRATSATRSRDSIKSKV